MTYLPSLIVCLWLLPIAGLVFILLVLLCVSFSLHIARPLFGSSETRSQRRKIRHEKRAHRRVYADDLKVDVSDGIDFFNGIVCDISKLGICIMGIPEKLFKKTDRLTVVVDSQGETYAFHVMPRWQRSGVAGRQIGASIEYAPDGWYEFVKDKSSFAQLAY